eukprot:2029563-Amphidinium_carterae.1
MHSTSECRGHHHYHHHHHHHHHPASSATNSSSSSRTLVFVNNHCRPQKVLLVSGSRSTRNPASRGDENETAGSSLVQGRSPNVLQALDVHSAATTGDHLFYLVTARCNPNTTPAALSRCKQPSNPDERRKAQSNLLAGSLSAEMTRRCASLSAFSASAWFSA